MDNLNFDSSCKYEVLAEISFHADTTKNQFVKLLCSRLLARCYLKYILIQLYCLIQLCLLKLTG